MDERNEKRRIFEPIVDLLGEVLGFFTLALILLLYINGHFNFIPQNVTDILSVIREIAIITVIALVGLEFALKGRWLRMIIFFVMLAGVIIFMFFTGAIPGWTVSQ